MPRVAKQSPNDGQDLVIQQNIIKYRKLKGLTQQELAQAVGLSRSGLADIELGRNKAYAETLARIAKALGTTADSLLGLSGTDTDETIPSLRFLRRLAIIETFPEAKKKHILRTLDDSIKANSEPSATLE